MNHEKRIPIILLSGFLGSGKTTLLMNIIERLDTQGVKPAILLNEIGEINVEGHAIKSDVPTSEVLGGCICCSSKGDLTSELHQMISQYNPDIIIVESTGVAHPIETIDAITELSMYKHIQLSHVVTVVDSKQFVQAFRGRKTTTTRLLKEQTACASQLILNKVDRLEAEEVLEAEQFIREWNPHAQLHISRHCKISDWSWLDEALDSDYEYQSHKAPHSCSHHEDKPCTHHSHQHVMSYTHYWNNPIHSKQFENWLMQLPQNIYRAKGIVRFCDIPSRYLFQFAYRESDFIKIEPQGKVLDAAVFIGEHFDQAWLIEQLQRLERLELGEE